MFDPTIGQFLSEDPIEFDAGDPNLKRYVLNSPTNFTDPSGLNPNQEGARDADELIEIVKQIEEDYRQEHGSYPDWRTAMKLLLAKQTEGENAQHFYVFSRADKRWIDMRHFAASAVCADTAGPMASTWGGGFVEVYQFIVDFWPGQGQAGGSISGPDSSGSPSGSGRGNAASALGAEDIYSNDLGIAFYRNLAREDEQGMCFMLSGQLERMFNDPAYDIGKETDAESYEYLPQDEETWQNWYHDDAIWEKLEEKEGAMVLVPQTAP